MKITLLRLPLLMVFLLSPYYLPATPMPEFTVRSAEYWINSQPLTKTELQGNVVLLEIWTSI